MSGRSSAYDDLGGRLHEPVDDDCVVDDLADARRAKRDRQRAVALGRRRAVGRPWPTKASKVVVAECLEDARRRLRLAGGKAP